jgi:hypothetical protein
MTDTPTETTKPKPSKPKKQKVKRTAKAKGKRKPQADVRSMVKAAIRELEQKKKQLARVLKLLR